MGSAREKRGRCEDELGETGREKTGVAQLSYFADLALDSPEARSYSAATNEAPATQTRSLLRFMDAGVAQLVRVPACHAGGRGFEPRHSRHFPLKIQIVGKWRSRLV
ncbi:hypothetical protein RHIZ404_210412 [Rhizobium sp. EC-SD404]|nr:hypothetical protein RHIZ404_210412 [Rhizobium sp. EC-SD404]